MLMKQRKIKKKKNPSQKGVVDKFAYDLIILLF